MHDFNTSLIGRIATASYDGGELTVEDTYGARELGQAHAAVVTLTGTYHNLLRMWVEI